MGLRSGTAVAVGMASNCSSDLTPHLGISIFHGCSPKKTKKEKKKKRLRGRKKLIKDAVTTKDASAGSSGVGMTLQS